MVYSVILCFQHSPSKSQDQVFTWLWKAWFCTCNLRNVFNTSFSLHCLLMPSSHLWITSIKSISSVYSLHPPSSVSGCFLQLLYIQVRKAWISYLLSAHSGRESSCLTSSWRSFFCFSFSLPATAHTSHIQQGVWPKEEEYPQGETTGLTQETRLGRLPLGTREQWELLKSFKMPQKHIFIKSYSLGVKRTKDNIIFFWQYNFIDL